MKLKLVTIGFAKRIGFASLIGFAGLLRAQAIAPPAASTIAIPVIGIIDFYGVGKIPLDKVRKALGVNEGDALPVSKADTEERINSIPSVVESHLEAVCCEGGKVILYVGLEERGAARLDVREEPEGETKLPDPVWQTYQEYLDAAGKAGTGMAQDLTRGFALSADPATRAAQWRFTDLVKENARAIRDVLRDAYDQEQRAAAAQLAAYNPVKPDTNGDLQFALRDSAPAVRAVAADGLLALQVYAQLNPREKLEIQPTWFIEMLNSLSWSDRNHALKVLDLMTGDGAYGRMAILDQLRERSLAALAEMSRWKTPEHALPAFLLLGRVAGLTEAQMQEAWGKSDREGVIKAAQEAGKRKR